jgi:hypothetical protein
MLFLALWRPYSRRFSVLTHFSKLEGIDARTMPSLNAAKVVKKAKMLNEKNARIRWDRAGMQFWLNHPI